MIRRKYGGGVPTIQEPAMEFSEKMNRISEKKNIETREKVKVYVFNDEQHCRVIRADEIDEDDRPPRFALTGSAPVDSNSRPISSGHQLYRRVYRTTTYRPTCPNHTIPRNPKEGRRLQQPPAPSWVL